MTATPQPNRKPWLLAAAAAVLLLAGLAYALTSSGQAGRSAAGQAFFSVDDGQTWFADDAAKLAPFDHDGRQAVRAHVYRCADGTEFVNHVEQFNPAAKRALEASRSDPQGQINSDKSAVRDAYVSGRQVKRPGQAKWVSAGNFRAAAGVTAVKCPDGGTEAVPVEPGAG